MKTFFSLNIIWKKLEKRKIKFFSLGGILLFYIIYNLNYNIQNNMETIFFELLLNLILSMSSGVFFSGIILFGWVNIEQKKNSFFNKSEILNFDYFLRVYILFYLIMLPIGMLF